MSEFVDCANLSELPPGTCRVAKAAAREVALFNVNGTIFCLDNTCLHRGGPLGEGTLEGDVITCPWHGWRYNVRTGENTLDSEVRVVTHPVEVDENDVKVAL